MNPRIAVRAIKERARNTKGIALLDGLRAAAAARVSRSRKKRLEFTALAARRFAFAEHPRLIASLCAPYYDPRSPELWRLLRVGWTRYDAGFGDILNDRDLRTSLILKAPTPRERGVLYMSFEYNLMRVVASGRLPEIARRYWLVCSTSWSPMDYAIVGNVMNAEEAPLFLGISHDVDIANFEALAPLVVPVPLLASDWLRPEGFNPRPRAERDLDIVMVANWTVFKRHWLLFEALAGMPRELRVVLIGRDGDGRTAETIEAEARQYGATQRLELLTDIPHHVVRDLLCRAKVSPLLSFREGSCVAVTESMFADTPVVMMRDGHVGSSRYISEETGRIVSRGQLARTLMGYISGKCPCSPRATIIRRSNARRSSEILNSILRDHAEACGEPWSAAIAPFCWDGVPRYLAAEDVERFRDAYGALESEHGIRVLGWEGAEKPAT